MKNALTITIACSLALIVSQGSSGQQAPARTSAAVAEENGNRQQDGLEGPVRRVRVETAKMMVKGGKSVEGPRVLRGIATYDSSGTKIDAVDYPVEGSTVAGKERYRYDDKGNIIETVVLSNEGSILSKEAYDYEFDPVGNWTKMNTSIAVYENGKVTFEPIEVTYRTISYYYNQAIEKLSNTAAKAKPATPPSTTADLSHAKVASKTVSTNQPVAEKVSADVKETAAAPAPITPARVQPNDATARNAAAKTEEAIVVPPPKPSVLKVEENTLRSAALDIPQPEYPQAALLARATGKVEVQLLVNEKGLVTNARAQNGSPLLAPAAEAAALKARFAPTKLSADPAMAFGIITYHFALPETANTNRASISPAESRPPASEERKAAPQPVQEKTAFASKPATLTETKPKTTAEPVASNYDKGVAFLIEGRYLEAVASLNQAVQADPNDAKAYVKLGMSYAGMHQDKEAVAGFKMAAQIKRSALDAAAYHSWGRSYLALEKTSDAISAFKQALSLLRAEAIGLEPKPVAGMPSLEQVHFDMGTAYINSRRFNDSIKEFKQVITLNPSNAEAHYALAIAYINTGDRKAAEDEITILNKLDPTLAEKITSTLNEATSRHGCRNIACRR